MMKLSRTTALVRSFMFHVTLCWVIKGIGSRSVKNHAELNLWREERQAASWPGDPLTLYGNVKHCQPPEPAELREPAHYEDETWSILFSRYTLDAGDELDVWLVNQEVHPETKDQKHVEDSVGDTIIPILFPLFFIIFLALSTILIPLLGAAGFRILITIWWLITHAELKRVGRRTIIIYEKILRKRRRMLMPETVRKLPKSRFRLPDYFRLYTDEDVPSELEESDDDDWLVHEEETDDDMEDEVVQQQEKEHMQEEEVPPLVSPSQLYLDFEEKMAKASHSHDHDKHKDLPVENSYEHTPRSKRRSSQNEGDLFGKSKPEILL